MTRRDVRTRGELVWIFIPASTRLEQAGASTRAPSTSTTQRRQALTGVSVSRKHNVGMSTPAFRHPSRIVEPVLKSTRAYVPRPLPRRARRPSDVEACGSPFNTAFAWEETRHSHSTLPGLLRLHSRFGLPRLLTRPRRTSVPRDFDASVTIAIAQVATKAYDTSRTDLHRLR